MKLKSAEPLLLTRLGCPLAFDVIDADNPTNGIIGRATYERWLEEAGIIEYTIKVQIDGRCLMGSIFIKTLTKS